LTIHNKISEKLILKRDELERRIGKINGDYANTLDSDSKEQAVELENSEVLDVIHREALQELEQINKTLELIDRDEYGTCIECGLAIPVKRLEIIPHATFCINCATEREKK